VDTSYLAIRMLEGNIGENPRINDITHSSYDETWTQPWGEERDVRNNYNEMLVSLTEQGESPIEFSIVFRVFDDGIGFRYDIPEQPELPKVTIMDENTEFAIAEDGVAWSIPWDHEYYEHLYETSPISRLDTVCSPLTMKIKDNLYLALHEANLTDYASMNLTPVDSSTRLRTYLTPLSTGEKVVTATPMQSPWRTLIMAENPGGLMLSRLMLNLNEPCAIEDPSWCKPGRYIGIWWGMHMKDYTWEQGPKHGATTENTKRYIDFAAEHGYDGVLVEGWNKGWDGDWNANGDKFSFTEAYPDFDLEEITEYARLKGVSLIGHHETGGAAQNYEKQMEDAFSLYEKLGVNCVKTGYVNLLLDGKELHGSQYGVRHYRKVIENAAKHHIVIDNHEPVMPTGLQRTYPNLMTQEGMRGQEYDAWSPDGGNPPEHTCVLPFTRGLAGPMDFTPGTFNFTNKAQPGTRPNTTVAKQLALAVVIYSPLVMSSDQIENYAGRPEFEFIRTCPTNWDKTLVPEAKIGEYVTIVRKERDADNWYVGAITASNGRDTELDCSFLPKGQRYKATVYT
ncbi:MAG: glycoside hydrolase family 97 protein, partial [Muribaculaceae bacterium]|nr:glycoside hydrolase family 97 protein [Muribaculaceae bacterium]